MAEYKLIYFDGRGRAEFLRYAFEYAKVPYDDQLISFSDWKVMKKDTPMGSLPVLEYKGERLCQSAALARFLGFQFGLIGKNNVENAKLDMYGDNLLQDLIGAYTPCYRPRLSGDNETSMKNYAVFKEQSLKPFLDRYEKIIGQNPGKLLVGDKITWVDLCFGEFLQRLQHMFDAACLDGHPAVKAYVAKIHALPAIAAYCAKRNNDRKF